MNDLLHALAEIDRKQDEIERLRAEVAALKAEVRDGDRRCAMLHDANAELRERLRYALDDHDEEITNDLAGIAGEIANNPNFGIATSQRITIEKALIAAAVTIADLRRRVVRAGLVLLRPHPARPGDANE